MFFSTDLLSVRGGKFGTIWLLATTRNGKTVMKKYRAELLKTYIYKLCRELIKMFPVQCRGRIIASPGAWMTLVKMMDDEGYELILLPTLPLLRRE